VIQKEFKLDKVHAALVLASLSVQKQLEKALSDALKKDLTSRREILFSFVMAARNGELEIAKLLFDSFNQKSLIDSQCPNFPWWTALMGAGNEGHLDVVNWLLENGANLEAKDNQGWTALTWAANAGQTEIVVSLIKAGASLEAKDNLGWTALTCAANAGQTEIVASLIKAGAYLDAASTSGLTPLMAAAFKGHEDSIKTLLKNGANLLLVSDKGKSAIGLAEEGHQYKIAKFLREVEKSSTKGSLSKKKGVSFFVER